MGREFAWIAAITLVLLVLGGVVYQLFGVMTDTTSPPFLTNYSAVLGADGVLTETCTYWTGGGYHYLYRVWMAPLYEKGAGEGPRVELLSIKCPKGSIPYMRDHDDKLHVYAETNETPLEAGLDEAGCYFPKGIPRKPLTVTYVFAVHPPATCGGGYCYVKLSLASYHIPYDSVHVSVEGAEKAQLLAEDVERTGGASWSARSPEDEPMILYLLYRGAPPWLGNTTRGDALALYERDVAGGPGERGLLRSLAPLVVLAAPATFLALYLALGTEREKPFVPEYTYYVPDERLKPWQVALVFGSRPGVLGSEAVAATIIDLAVKGLLRIKPVGETVIELPEKVPEGLDWYERGVLGLLKLLEYPRGVWRPSLSKRLLLEDPDLREEVRGVMEGLTGKVETPLLRRYIAAPPGWLSAAGVAILLLGFAYIVLDGSPLHGVWSSVPGALIFMVGAGVLAYSLLPSDVSGRWRPGRRREALQWWSFRETLRKLVLMRGALPQDVSLWKKWLSYGTALGVGENVVSALRLRGIDLPEISAANDVMIATTTIYASTAASSSSSGGFGGGGGGGGGFGGGGAGVR